MDNKALSWTAEDPGAPAPAATVGGSPAASAPAFVPVSWEQPPPAATARVPAPTSAAAGGGGINVPASPLYTQTGGLQGNTPPPATVAFTPQAAPTHHHQRTGSGDAAVAGGGGDPTALRFGHPEDDLPLLEELGIFPAHILAKSQAVLHPLRTYSDDVVEDADLAGPLVIAVALGALLTLQGKLHFGAIYGLSMASIVLGYWLLALMSDANVQFVLVVSTLGYCLLPNCILAVFSTLHLWLIGRAPGVLLALAALTVLWSAWCATKMFTQAYQLHAQRFLVLYPTLLMYCLFAAVTIF